MIEQEAYRRLKSKGLLSLPFFLYGIVPPVITQPAFPASSSGVFDPRGSRQMSNPTFGWIGHLARCSRE